MKAREARRAIADAKKAVERAEKTRRDIFRKALVALFNEHRLFIFADGDQSARLKIEELRDGHDYPITELPE